jgi:hypothetical protein
MQAASFEALEKANVPVPFIRALAQVFEIEVPARQQHLATRADLNATRADITALRHDMDLGFEKLRTEMHANSSNLARQMYLAILGQMAVLLSAAYFFVTQLR